jgi:hypothetical protein
MPSTTCGRFVGMFIPQTLPLRALALGSSFLAASIAVACGGSTPPVQNAEATSSTPVTVTSTTTPGPSATAIVSVPEAKGSAEPAPVASASGAPPEMAAELSKMIESAKKNETGANNCEKAYNAAVGMIKEMEASAEKARKEGAKVTTKGTIPNKPKFLKACGGLSKETQQCMLMSYALEHQEECKKEMTPEKMEKFKKAMK